MSDEKKLVEKLVEAVRTRHVGDFNAYYLALSEHDQAIFMEGFALGAGTFGYLRGQLSSAGLNKEVWGLQ